MRVMETLYGFVTEYFIYLWFVVVLGVVVFVHELGHYLVGRWCGIHAEVFSIGFGRELFGWVDRRGTRWRVSLLPLGGYVKFLGDADGSSRADPEMLASMDPQTRAHSFHGAAVWRRALTVAAGPVFNFLFSILVFAALALWVGKAQDSAVIGSVVEVPGHETGLKPGDVILALNGKPVANLREFYTEAGKVEPGTPLKIELERDGTRRMLEIPTLQPPLVGDVHPYSAAWRAGLKEGDLILEVDGRPIPDFSALQKVVLASEGRELTVTFQRGTELHTVTMTPKVTDIPTADGGFEKRVLIGVGILPVIGPVVESQSLPDALLSGVVRTEQVIVSSISGLVHIIRGDVSAKNLQGPIGIAQLSGEMAKLGLDRLISLVALISTAIGLLNLFPIPVLDGGHLVFLGIETATGRPPEGRWVDFATALGLAMVLLLMLFATYNDVLRLIGLA
ncbi:MAG: RIP metalloprotease RseP [Alphaproteobacteria bacterium]|nr:MAG: RIP metalloprotease RseP [Alphaproteobacteria bacterium]